MFESQIEASASTWDVLPTWIQAVIDVESDWNPEAYNVNDPGGAYGLMQITGATAGLYGVTDLNSLFDPAINIDLGSHILHDLIASYGSDPRNVYSAYNSGDPEKWKTNGTVAANVQRFMDALAFYSNPAPAPVSTPMLILGVVLVLAMMRR